MARGAQKTREQIVDAANALFYDEGIRAVSMDAIAAKAALTKRTLYYHFASKDDLIAAYLKSRDQPNLKLFAKWFNQTQGTLAQKVEGMFLRLAKSARHHKWKGCGFLRTAAELANMPGHPAMKIGAAHKKKFESWLTEIFTQHGCEDAAMLARQIMVLMDGAFSTMLVHNDTAYIQEAGRAAAALVALKS